MQIAIVGFGFMGRMHFANWSRCEGVDIVAICEQNPNVLQNLNNPIGNIEGLPVAIDLSRVNLYSDLSEMLAAERLDAVSITLPTHLHADCSIRALQAGVHVLCEKPMALTIDQCDSMIEAAQRSGKHLMIGHCIRFWPEYVKAKELIDSGHYGRVLAASFRRLTAAPIWSSGNWLTDEQRSGGMPLDLHIHDADFIQSLFGLPTAVCSHATLQNDSITHIHTLYDYRDKRAIGAEGSWLPTPSFGFQMSFDILLEKATVVYDCTCRPTFRLCPADDQPVTPPLADGDGYAREIAHFAALIQGKTTDPVITPAQSRDSVRMIEAERLSATTGRPVELTPHNP